MLKQFSTGDFFRSGLLLGVLIGGAAADPPPNYYDSVDASSASALRATLHAVIDDHTRFPYSSGGTDTWTILELADEDPNNSANVLDVYRNASYAKVGAGNPNYDREHSWPNSYGFPSDPPQNYPYTDCHQLFIANSSYNSSRGNNPYNTCSAACDEKVTDVNDGQGGGSGTYPGNSNWRSGAGATGSWETWNGRRGDVARAQFYMDVRYEGGTHGVTGVAEPDLILTDSTSLIASGNTGSVEPVAYMGLKSVLVQWHIEDPVDDRERARNDVVFSFQGNRNPFVDHPEWVDCLFGSGCGTVNPAAPAGLTATGGDMVVNLDWFDNSDADLDGYNVYRALVSGGPYAPLNGTLVLSSNYSDTTVINGTPYYYRVTAVDTDTNESAMSNQASATPSGVPPSLSVWINEIHYDNAGTDVDEGIEIAGLAGTNLSGWSLQGYSSGATGLYLTVPISGVIPDQQDGYGTLWFAFLGLQNGPSDGVALVDPSSIALQFLSYEGGLTGVGGAANGMASTNIGVSEAGTAPVGQSLQLQGTGSEYGDFTWSSSIAHTRGLPNTGQTFFSGPPVPTVGTWGAVVMTCLILVSGTIKSRRR